MTPVASFWVSTPARSAWEGNQGADEGDRIGMLLDLGQGSMTVWKNDERPGVMQAESLRPPLWWAVVLDTTVGDNARIESPPAPPSSTEEELAATKTWQAANTQ